MEGSDATNADHRLKANPRDGRADNCCRGSDVGSSRSTAGLWTQMSQQQVMKTADLTSVYTSHCVPCLTVYIIYRMILDLGQIEHPFKSYVALFITENRDFIFMPHRCHLCPTLDLTPWFDRDPYIRPI